jgi:hypothetical protein
LGDIAHISKELAKRKAADKVVTKLHQLLFGRPGEVSSTFCFFDAFVGDKEKGKPKTIQWDQARAQGATRQAVRRRTAPTLYILELGAIR